MNTPQPQQESKQMLKHVDKSFCYCIIDPDSEPEHDCDSNHCTSLDHVRKGCRCGFDRASNSHHKNDCAFCRTSKESLQVDLSLCNSMSHRVYGKCKNCGGIEQKSTEPYVTPELTEEQRTVSVIYACVKEERLDWAINYLKTYVIQELELQRRELEQKHQDRLLVIQSIVMQSVVLAIDNFAAGRPKEAFKQLEDLKKYGKERLIKRGME